MAFFVSEGKLMISSDWNLSQDYQRIVWRLNEGVRGLVVVEYYFYFWIRFCLVGPPSRLVC